jgi:uncharacterized protein (TIGR02118 family)
MITLIICVRRAAHVSHEFFETYWRGTHGPLVASETDFTRHIHSYRQFHLLGGSAGVATGQPDFDGIALLSFESAEAMAAAFAEPRFLSMLEPDTVNFGNLPESAQYIVETVASGEPERRHGKVAIFVFPGAGAKVAPAGSKPISVTHFRSRSEFGDAQEESVEIMMSSFDDDRDAAAALSGLSANALDGSLVVAAREHVFF